MSNPFPPIVGTDGQVPVYDPEGKWTIWGHHEIYLGNEGANRYVPKVNDYVIDYISYTTYRVESLDPITLIPTLLEVRPANMTYDLNQTDLLFGVGPGTPADTYRLYLDKSVIPFKVDVEHRLHVYGSMCEYYKLFKGPVASDHVISRVYDNNGTFISENVPLELAALENMTNYSVKVPMTCSTNEDLMEDEIVTFVAYSDNGHVVSQRQLLVTNTSFIRSINSSAKYVSHISLECPFISPTLDHLLEFPINVPMNALNVIGVVHYTDGSVSKFPANGVRFSLFGLDDYVSTIIGQEISLALRYTLAQDEYAIAGITTDGHYISEPYTLRTVNPNNSYTVKLFGYPVWVDVNNGYRMEWWLYNLDRNTIFNVTSFVMFDVNYGAFNPKAYGILQRKSVSINLRDVSGSFKPYTHIQLVDITLYGDPNNYQTPWTVNHVSSDSVSPYGINLYGNKIGSQTLNISSGITDYTEWKERVFNSIQPLRDRSLELSVPDPTHITISYGTFETTITRFNWNLDIVTGIDITLFDSVKIKFIKRTISGDLQLGIAYMTIKQI